MTDVESGGLEASVAMSVFHHTAPLYEVCPIIIETEVNREDMRLASPMQKKEKSR